MCEARTKAQESYLAGVVYSTCRVDLSRSAGPGRYSGIRADSRGFMGTYGHKCAGMSTGAWGADATGMWTGAWRVSARASGMRRHWTHGRGTGTVGTGRTDMAHETVSTRRMGRGQDRRSWWYLSWSGTRRGRRVLRGGDCNRTGQTPDGPGYCSNTLL